MDSESFAYRGKRVLVVGGATGMGAAAARLTAELGAEIAVLDVADVAYPAEQAIKLDLRDQASVDAAIEALNGPFDVVFACAGVADGTRGLMLINFIAQRHLIEALVEREQLRTGGAIVMISSVAGLPWQQNMAQVFDFLNTPDWPSAAAWVDAHEGTDSYSFSKQAVNGYVSRQAFPLLRRGIRVNAVLPGPTDTPLARANANVWLAFGQDYRDAAGVDTLVPDDIAGVMAFLGSDAARGVNGVTLLVDQGQIAAGMTDAFEAPRIKAMLGVT
jgi:NAD(P)-dependent dehydrogenase (short-subunit alcohol dehydrogenase family)